METVLKLWRWDSNKISWKKLPMKGTTSMHHHKSLCWLQLTVLTGSFPPNQWHKFPEHSAQSTSWEMSMDLESSIPVWNESVLKGQEFVLSLISFQWFQHCLWVLNHYCHGRTGLDTSVTKLLFNGWTKAATWGSPRLLVCGWTVLEHSLSLSQTEQQ